MTPEALAALRHLRAERPDDAAAAHNLAFLLSRQRDPAAEENYRAALELKPQSADTALALAFWLLREGRYAEGWPLHERRREVARVKLPLMPAHRPEWRGEDLAGKRLLVVGEQGFGDQIMFARFHDELRRRGAELTYIAPGPLQRLLGGVGAARLSEHDFWAYQQSLPRWLGVRLESVPAPKRLPVTWRRRGGVGVAPSGDRTNPRDGARSLDNRSSEWLLRLGMDLRPEATGAADFLETAEIVAGLDLVITVDTAIAHLAASAGTPTWVLLPAVLPDWRWMYDRTDSPWYPSARLFRQHTPGDWASVMDDVTAALAAEGFS